MRIAVSGSHRVGKTTLAEALAETLPRHEFVPEPYHLLEEDGYAFGEMPSIEDFELQLERSLQCAEEGGTNVVFDRCAVDLLGYLAVHRNADGFRPEDWLPRVGESMATLDVIIFVPIEEPDRIVVPPSEMRFRAEVDAVLRDLIVNDAYGLGCDVMTVEGTAADRLHRVMVGLRVEPPRKEPS